jgi:DNA polymerase
VSSSGTLAPRATIDFETRSECDLKKHGSWRYSLDPTTTVLCMAWHLPSWPEDRYGLWHPDLPQLGLPEEDMTGDLMELLDWVQNGGIVEAHNAWFERGIWTNLLVARYGFPSVTHRQWRCSAAKAAALALPRALGDAVDALMLSAKKDAEGHALMKKICKPRKALKAEKDEWKADHNAGKCLKCKGKGTYKRAACPVCGGYKVLGVDEDAVPEMPTKWHETEEMLTRLWAYCGDDVLGEVGLSACLPDLNEAETELYLLDQAINERGFQLDTEAVDSALKLIAAETLDLNAQLTAITGGQVTKATQRERMKAWFESEGLLLDDTKGATIDAELAKASDGPVKRALSILRELGRSSTSKYQAMRRWSCPDGRVRGGLLYHGATTGRWSGAGVQPHNFVRGSIKDQSKLWDILKTNDREAIRAEFGSVMLALANGLRGAICAAPGSTLYVADYASIEARVLLWLAGDEEHLNLFRRNEDLYCDMASRIYARPINKKDHPEERQLGKVAILGLGYQMGAAKFVEAARIMGGIDISEAMAKQVVDAYREKYYMVADLWYAQEAAAIEAVTERRLVYCGPVSWIYDEDERFLYCELPSARRLAYPFPEMHRRRTAWGKDKWSLTFMGVNPYNRQWERQPTYGGKIVENEVQAIARDLMAESMLVCEKSGIYRPVLSVHDELVAEADDGKGDVKEFEALMAKPPDWAPTCPIAAEGWSGKRYRK